MVVVGARKRRTQGRRWFHGGQANRRVVLRDQVWSISRPTIMRLAKTMAVQRLSRPDPSAA